MRVTYLNGDLEFSKPLRRRSLLFRKKDHHLQIRPDEWNEVYRYSSKGSTSYYFRNNRTAAYFVSADGLHFFSRDLKKLFPGRIRENDEFPRKIRRKLKKEFPGRVM